MYFGIMLFVDNTSLIMLAIFSCHIVISFLQI